MEHASSARTPFDWLYDPNDRGSALRQIESALNRGWLDPAAADAAPLKRVLSELVVDPTTTAAQRRRMLRVLGLLDDRGGQSADIEARRARPTARTGP